jgi:hypothetical protein
MTDIIPTIHQTEPEPADSNLWQPKPRVATSSQKPPQPVSEPVDTVDVSGASEDGILFNGSARDSTTVSGGYSQPK